METSLIIQWLRSLYNTIFFYGLEPAPTQRKYKEKIMRELEHSDGSTRKNRSPFFTPSEQRVQRYIAAKESKTTMSNKERLEDELEEDEKPRGSGRRSSPSMRATTTTATKRPQSSRTKMLSELENRILDLNEELELVDAEILTMPKGSEGSKRYTTLMEQRERLLDLIEEVNIEIVAVSEVR